MSLVHRQLAAFWELLRMRARSEDSSRTLTRSVSEASSLTLRVGVCVALLVACPALWSQEPPKDKDTPEPISYYRQVRPIFQQHCQGCHQPAKDQGGFVMPDQASLLRPGNSNQPGIVPGQFVKSLV